MAKERRLIYVDSGKTVLEYMTKHICVGESDFLKGYLAGIKCLANGLAELPPVDAVEVVHGRWEDMYDGRYANPRCRCSVCKEKALYHSKRDFLGNWESVQALTDYCPNCGAKMDGGINK